MVRKVLVVEDDRVFQRLVQNKLSQYQKYFEVMIAADGQEAVAKLKKHSISLVVTDLNMPQMDGLELMAHMTVYYPDIPVIVLTGDQTAQRKDAAIQHGAVSLFEKPFEAEKLGGKILETLKKESEGGLLQAVSLQMFAQLVDMEGRTCTIRVINKLNGRKGVLFFRNGELMDARYANVYGSGAAYQIFSWDETILFIQNDCPLSKKRIEADLQAILVEALRRKDEAEMVAAPNDAKADVEHPDQNENQVIAESDAFGEMQQISEEILSGYPLLPEDKKQQVQAHFRECHKVVLAAKADRN